MVNPCFCIPLRIGCVVIGILEIIGYSLFLFKTVISLGGSELLSVKDVAEIDRDLNKNPISDDEFKHVKRVVIQYSLLLLLNFIQEIAGILLLVGALKSSAILLKIWLSIKIKSFLLSTILFAVSMATGSRMKEHWPDLVSLCIGAYFILIVIFFHREMRKQELVKVENVKNCDQKL